MKLVSEMMIEGSLYCRDVLGKPVFLSVSLDPFLDDDEDRRGNLMLKQAFEQNHFPVYASSDATIRALARLYKYAVQTGQAIA